MTVIKLLKLLYRKPFVYMLPDRLHIKLMYRFRMKRKLNLKKPESFTEKIQWLKLNDRKPIYSVMADKIEARKFIKDKIGEKYLIPLLSTYDNADQIDFELLPEQFVIKCNHNSKSTYVSRKKNKEEYTKKMEIFNARLKRNYFYYFREWAYKDIKPRLLCEKYMEDSSTKELRDYRFYCFNGKVKIIGIDYDIIKAYKRSLYTADWEFIDVRYKHLKGKEEDNKKPEQLDKMIELAEILAEDLYFLRVDLFIADGVIYSGELTFYPSGGYSKFDPPEFDYEIGSLLDLNI